MPITRRGFLKAAGAGIAIVAAMPNLAEAEAQRFWSLDRTMIRAVAPEPILEPANVQAGLGGTWDVQLTPGGYGDGIFARWVSQSWLEPGGLEPTPPVIISQLPVEAVAWMPPDNPLAPIAGALLRSVGPDARLGHVEWGYTNSHGMVYRPILGAERDAARRNGR